MKRKTTPPAETLHQAETTNTIRVSWEEKGKIKHMFFNGVTDNQVPEVLARIIFDREVPDTGIVRIKQHLQFHASVKYFRNLTPKGVGK